MSEEEMEDAAALGLPLVEAMEELKSEVEREVVRRPVVPVDTFPEVWRNIFEKLDLLEDKKTFSRASAPSRNLVAKKRTEKLLPTAVHALVKKHPRRHLIKLREVSLMMTKELDQQLQNHSSNFRLYDDEEFQQEVEDTGHTGWINHFWSPEDIQEFLEEMSSHQGNPFPGKMVQAGWDGPDDFHLPLEQRERVRFWRNATLLFQKFGKYVLVFRFILYNDLAGYFTNEDWDNFRNWLPYLPHLRKLNFCGPRDSDISHDMMENFRQNSLPQLLELESLELTAGFHLEKAFRESGVIPPNIKRIKRDDVIHSGSLPEALFNFPNLEVLYTRIDLNDLRRFGSLEKVPPFMELRLNFFEETVTMHQLFMALEPFGGTLIHLTVRSKIMMEADSGERFTMNLPKLETLEFYEYEGPLDPLVQLTSLRSFTIRMAKIKQENRRV